MPGTLRALPPPEPCAWRSVPRQARQRRRLFRDRIYVPQNQYIWYPAIIGRIDAFDARSGKMLWSFQTGSGLHGKPVTYRVGGKQYLVEGYAPEMYGANRGTALFVFALPE